MRGVRGASTLPLVGACVSAVLWAFGGIFAALTDCSGLVISFWRLWIGVVLYASLFALGRRRVRGELVRACAWGGIFLAGDMCFFFSAVRLTSVAIVTIVGSLQPVVVFVAARRLFGERRGPSDMAWMAAALGGVALTVVGASGSGPDRFAGDLLAFLAMLSWAGYWIASKRARERVGSLEYSTGVTVVAALVTTPVTLLSTGGVGSLTPRDWLLIASIALVPGAGHLVMNWVHRYLAASISSIIGNMSALVAALVAVPILHQSLSVPQVLGMALALTSVVVIVARHRSDPAPEGAP